MNEDLPVPADDGSCDHLPGIQVPSIDLLSTSGEWVNLAERERKTVVFCYPRTSPPGGRSPEGWSDIPGAKGCTPQNCAYRDNFQVLQDLGVDVFGLSTQDTDYQKEVVERLELPFSLLSDAEFKLTNPLNLPTFTVESMRLLKRLTFIISDGKIEKVFYPVFPSHEDVENVVKWLQG